ncbi:hypothetical protein M9H77_24029 [Catharanthus roseus]|uniref:Uncharacterized protein n=1 Tax=Catharanthus roseus TaxID=4058 RepID=A0ACC0AVD1_CATRO|nr:hypothetical protein M9H77_24029 [Catharanthus roseus]
MGVVLVKVDFLMLELWALFCFLVLPGSAGYSLFPSPLALPALSPDGDAAAAPVSHGTAFEAIAPAPESLRNGTFLHPPSASPPINSAPAPQNVKDPVPSFPPSMIQPPNASVTPPVYSSHTITVLPPSASKSKPSPLKHPVPEAPAPVASLPKTSPHNPATSPSAMQRSSPPKSHQNEPPEPPRTPVFNAPVPSGLPQSLPPPIVLPNISPSTFPAPVAPSPSKLPENHPPPTSPVLPIKSPSSFPGPATSPVHSSPRSTYPGRAGIPIASPPSRPISHQSHVKPLPTKAPSPHGSTGASDSGPPPFPFSRSPVGSKFHSPSSQPHTSLRHHHGWNKKNTLAPSAIVPPPPNTEQAPSHHPRTDPKTKLKFPGHPPSNSGSTISPFPDPFPPSKSPDSPVPSQSQQMPFLPPKTSPSGSSPRIPKKPLPAPVHALPPPPPNEDCISLTCSEPLTNGPPGSPCVCVFPMQVGLRLSVALYTFFPLVSELAAEIATGVFLKPSQVRIMGANAASQDPEKTIVLIDLVPLGEKFDNTTAYLTFQRFWHKQVVIKTSLFGDYEVLYVRYPGLPPSPPSAPSDIGIIGSDPYSGRNYNGAAIKPIGVDVGRQHQRGGPNGGVIAIIVLSASVAVILCCAVAWVLFFKHRDSICQQDSNPPATVPSLAKSSGLAASMIGSGPSSTSLSFHSSIAAYTGSAKTFSSSEVEKATDNFSETRVLGEGGFGRVYSGVLEDGTKVAVKILKRADQQGGREFLAEVEMLSRLHHRNLVKLIGICTEDRTRCLVYELIPNGSVESHLHGIHKESSPLDWSARMKIALGAARGLAYLHEDSSPRVIHRDFKSSNILLEHDFTPKVSDFGLARTAMDEENRHISTRVMGTFGYVAPEYAMTGHLLVKSDVYSYGVVLLELLTGRKPVDMSQPPGQENLVSWARPLLTTEESLESIVDPSLGPNFPIDSISKVAAIASMCVQPEVSHRPFMGEVVQALKLVCNECEETREFGSRSYSREDLSMDMDAKISNTSGLLQDPLQGQSPVSNYDSELDVERGYSASDLLGPYARQDTSGSPRRHSSSGPLRIGKKRRLWQKMRRFSGGSLSEHGLIYSTWH